MWSGSGVSCVWGMYSWNTLAALLCSVVGALVHLTWETLWQGEQQLKCDVLTVNVSRGTGGILTVHCCWTVSHVTHSQEQLLARSATNVILLSHHVAHSSGPTQSRAMGGAETSSIEHGLATTNSTVRYSSCFGSSRRNSYKVGYVNCASVQLLSKCLWWSLLTVAKCCC